MRTVKQINAEIKTLKAELKTVRNHELVLKAQKAITYVEKQGYKWNGSSWGRPATTTTEPNKPFPKPRQFITSDGNIYLVHDHIAQKVRARRVKAVSPQGIKVSPYLTTLWTTTRFHFVDEQYVRTMFA